MVSPAFVMAITDTHDLRAGSVLQGRYKIVSALGAGGFGAVYKAIQLATNQPVAIKVMHPIADEPEARRENRVARFRREMDLCARLQHPNIVGLVDSGQTDDGRLFAVFQFASGRSLDQVLTAEGSLHPREARHLMLQVLDALSCAHNLGVVHRDLKPANIMVVSTGTRRNALVLDFGIGAMAADSHDTGYAKLTSQHEWLGTPHYAAPEQIRGNPPSPQADIYSWGLVYLECLIGHPVIAGSPMVALMIHIGPDPIPIPPSLRHHRLGRLLQRAVIKDVADRTATAATLLRDLDNCDVSDLEQLVAADDPGPTVTGRLGLGAGDLGGPTQAGSTPEPSPRAVSPQGSATPSTPGSSERTTGRLVDGERRQITAVCCALAPAAGVELDELDVLIQAQQEICAEVAERFRGQLVGGLGHQVLIEFGYPTAREDDAVRAARAALAIRAAVVERGAGTGGARHMEIRVGIHTGMIAYGPSEAARRISSQIVGMTPMIASQLSAMAARDSIVTSAATAKALRAHIVMTPMGTQVVDGVGRGMELFRIEAERSSAKGTHDGDAPLPLVGREREMALLLERWSQVAAGAGQSVLITGEAGIGKSRLATELSRRVGPNVHTWLEARCTLETRNRVLHPIIEVLERVLDLGEVAPGARLDRIEAALVGFGFRPGDVVPLVAALLAVPQSDRYPAVELLAGAPARADAGRDRLAVDRAVRALAGRAVRRGSALGRSDHARAAGRAGHGGAVEPHAGAVQRPARVRAAVADLGDGSAPAVPAGAPAGRADRRAADRGQGAPRRGARADGQPDRRRAAVRRGADPDGDGVGGADRARRSLRADRLAVRGGHPDDAARLADGPARSAGPGQGDGAARGRAGARVRARAAHRGHAAGRGRGPGGPRQAGGGRPGPSQAAAAQPDLAVPPRADPRHRLRVDAAAGAAQGPRPDRRGARAAVRRRGRGAARSAGAPPRRGGAEAAARSATRRRRRSPR